VCVCPFQIFNQWVDFHKIWYELYANGENPNFIIFSFLQPVITKWWT